MPMTLQNDRISKEKTSLSDWPVGESAECFVD